MNLKNIAAGAQQLVAAAASAARRNARDNPTGGTTSKPLTPSEKLILILIPVAVIGACAAVYVYKRIKACCQPNNDNIGDIQIGDISDEENDISNLEIVVNDEEKSNEEIPPSAHKRRISIDSTNEKSDIRIVVSDEEKIPEEKILKRSPEEESLKEKILEGIPPRDHKRSISIDSTKGKIPEEKSNVQDDVNDDEKILKESLKKIPPNDHKRRISIINPTNVSWVKKTDNNQNLDNEPSSRKAQVTKFYMNNTSKDASQIS